MTTGLVQASNDSIFSPERVIRRKELKGRRTMNIPTKEIPKAIQTENMRELFPRRKGEIQKNVQGNDNLNVVSESSQFCFYGDSFCACECNMFSFLKIRYEHDEMAIMNLPFFLWHD